MMILDEIYCQFYKQSEQAHLKSEIEENHKILIERLSKEDRRLVLRIIDNKDLISEIRKKKSFICGFKLALELLIELKKYKEREMTSSS